MSTAEAGFSEMLRAQGLKVTANRLELFRVLSGHARPLSSAELARVLTARGISVATVYRMTQQLAEAGLVHAVMVGHDNIGYELVAPFRPHHDHLLCTGCGRTFDLADCGLDTIVRELGQRQGYEVTFHSLELHGLCPSCQTNTHPARQTETAHP